MSLIERWPQAMCPEHDAKLTMSNQGGWMCSSPTCHIVREPMWIEVVPAEQLEGAVVENERLREALDWIYTEPEDALKVQMWARAALDGRHIRPANDAERAELTIHRKDPE